MDIYRTLSIILGTSSVFLGSYVFYKKTKSRINILFFINCILWGVIFLINANTWSIPDKKAVEFNYILMYIIIFFALSLMLHFYIEFTGIKIRLYIKILFYLPAVILSLATIFSTTIFSDFIWHEYFWTAIPAYNSIWSIFYIIIYYILYAPLIIILLLRWAKNSESGKNKRQAKIIIFSICIIHLGSFIIGYISPLCNISLPPFGVLFYSPLIFSLFYCLVKYKFLTFDITGLTHEIMEEIDDFVILLNTGGKIIYSDVSFKKRISDQLNVSFIDIIAEDESLSNNFIKMLDGKINKFKGNHFFLKEGEKVYVNTSFSRIIDKFGDVEGILVVSKEIPDAKKFMDLYKITDRQFEIISFSINGMSNNEIAERLNLAKRTIETHLQNIYFKLSVRNKVELMKIATEFNLI